MVAVLQTGTPALSKEHMPFCVGKAPPAGFSDTPAPSVLSSVCEGVCCPFPAALPCAALALELH